MIITIQWKCPLPPPWVGKFLPFFLHWSASWVHTPHNLLLIGTLSRSNTYFFVNNLIWLKGLLCLKAQKVKNVRTWSTSLLQSGTPFPNFEPFIFFWRLPLLRYWAIHDPINYATKRTKGRVYCLILLVWLVSCLICLPPLIGEQSTVCYHGGPGGHIAIFSNYNQTDENQPKLFPMDVWWTCDASVNHLAMRTLRCQTWRIGY